MELFRNLNSEEEKEFRQWARDNYKTGEKIKESWHLVVRNECKKINEERVKKVKEQEKQRKRISKHVEEVLMREHYNCGITHLVGVKSSKEHIIMIGTSILCTKWKVGYERGSFVRAVVANDLMESFGRADDINQQCIRFYCRLLYNTGYIH